MALVSLYTLWNTSENRRVSCFQGAEKETSAMKWLRVIWSSVTYFATYKSKLSLYNWKDSYKLKLLIFLISSQMNLL